MEWIHHCNTTLDEMGDNFIKGKIDEKDYLDRVNILCSLGLNVIISNYMEYYRLIPYLSKFTRKRKIGMILGVYMENLSPKI